MFKSCLADFMLTAIWRELVGFVKTAIESGNNCLYGPTVQRPYESEKIFLNLFIYTYSCLNKLVYYDHTMLLFEHSLQLNFII